MEKSAKGRPKLNEIEVEETDLQNIINLSLKAVSKGRPEIYTDDTAGLERFKAKSKEYFEYLEQTNRTSEERTALIPDIEAYCCFCGISRMTLLNYEKLRGDEWRDYIQLVRTCITSAKKQLSFRGKIPTILAIFDLTNNSSYVNSSEFKLANLELQPQNNKVLTASDLPRLAPPEDEAGEPPTDNRHLESRYFEN